MSNTSMNAGNTPQDDAQESITQALESGDIQRGGANLNPTNSGTPATPVHDPFDQSQTVDRSNDPNYAKDPVCGLWVDKRTAANTLPAPVNMPMDTVYFDSPECKTLFEENPEKYGSNF